MKRILLILLILAGIIAGCKKFEDGPCFSLRSVKNRITGTWKVDKFYIDGADSTDEFNSKLGCEIEFSRDAYQTTNYIRTIYLKNCNNGKTLKGLWSFFNKENELHIYFTETLDFTNAIGPLGSDKDAFWTILRLTNKEFNLTIANWPDFIHGFKKTYIIKLKK